VRVILIQDLESYSALAALDTKGVHVGLSLDGPLLLVLYDIMRPIQSETKFPVTRRLLHLSPELLEEFHLLGLLGPLVVYRSL
jgi:hypothetical protein